MGYAMEMTEGYYNKLETYHEYTLIKIKKAKTTKKVMKKLERNAYYDFVIRAYKDVKLNGKNAGLFLWKNRLKSLGNLFYLFSLHWGKNLV